LSLIQANGFTGSRGVSKYIPPAYTHLMKTFYDQANQRAARRRRETHIELREWKREGWTYHAKGESLSLHSVVECKLTLLPPFAGIWLAPSHTSPIRHRPDFSTLADANDLDEELALARPLPPYLTLIGSSNYGNRSAQRDLEANLLVTTDAKPLQQQLGRELSEIRRYASDVVDERLFERKGRKVPWGVKVAAKAIEDML
jgi:CDP-diacylglycerol---glycerol-3-phosphate 3-phosphatidyltransferase